MLPCNVPFTYILLYCFCGSNYSCYGRYLLTLEQQQIHIFFYLAISRVSQAANKNNMFLPNLQNILLLKRKDKIIIKHYNIGSIVSIFMFILKYEHKCRKRAIRCDI